MATEELVESVWGDMVPWEDFPQNDWDSATGSAPGGVYAIIEDRSDGRFRPVYQFESDLHRQLASVRRVIGLNELTEAVTTALRVYIFGKGIEVGVRATARKNVPPDLVDDVKRVVDRFIENNGFINGLDTEIHQRSRDDGEACLPIERDGNDIICEPIETVQLTEPAAGRSLEPWISHAFGIDFDCFVPSWSFGVLSDFKRPSRAKGYHVVYDGAGRDYEFFPPERFVHIKRNVPRSAKRGISDWLAVLDRINRVGKLVRNLSHGAALQSAIAWIEEYAAGTPASQIMGSGSPGIGGNVQNGRNGSRQERTVTYKEGSILRVGIGKQYKPGPLGAERNAGFQVVEEMLERLIGTRWLMPYAMISGDASNNNFASGLVAEAPFVKAREADQQFYGGAYKSLLWKVVRYAVQLGWLDTRGVPCDRLEELIDITVDFTSPASRDRSQLVDQLVKEVGLGATSLRTAAVELGRDYEEEVAAGASASAAIGGEIASAAPGGVVDAGSENVAASALNGAQIGSLMNILDAVTSKRIPPETALVTMQAAFPSLSADVLNGILNPLIGYVSPILADGTPNPAASSADVSGATGEMANISTQQWNRNTKAIRKILDEFKAGGSRVIAKGMLTALSIPDVKAEEYLDDASDGSIDSPELSDTEQAAVGAALESVETTEEALQVLRSIRDYP